MAKNKKVSKIKVKKKRWFSIFAPKFLGQKEIGESYLGEPQAAIGRVLKINLRELTGNIRDQNIYVSLKITEISGSNLQTEITGYAYMPFFVRKLIRAGTGKIDDSFVLKTKEGRTVRIKPLIVTVFGVNKSTKTSIRKKLREILEEELSKLTFDSLMVDLLRYRLQMDSKKKLNKICPVRETIMRMVKLEEGKRPLVKKEEKKVPPASLRPSASNHSDKSLKQPLPATKEAKEVPPPKTPGSLRPSAPNPSDKSLKRPPSEEGKEVEEKK